MSTLLHLVQGTPEWHAHRRNYRNASETPAVLGLSPWQTPFQLWEVKTGRREQAVNFAMQRGSVLEVIARETYETETGLVMEPCVMVDGEYSASLDGISLAGDLILEVKCPLKGKDSDTWKQVAEGKVPEHYFYQVQHQLMVSQAGKAHFYVYDSDGAEGIWVDVLPDVEAIARIRTAWDGFWMSMESDQAPPLSDQDTVLRTDSAWATAASAYLVARQAADEATARMASAKAELGFLANHSSERGCGVTVTRVWKGSQAEVRVRVAKGEQAMHV